MLVIKAFVIIKMVAVAMAYNSSVFFLSLFFSRVCPDHIPYSIQPNKQTIEHRLDGTQLSSTDFIQAIKNSTIQLN